MDRMIRSRHKHLTSHPGIPANPQNARKAATTVRISSVTARENICSEHYGLKRARTPVRM
jgi:hypothetical protein